MSLKMHTMRQKAMKHASDATAELSAQQTRDEAALKKHRLIKDIVAYGGGIVAGAACFINPIVGGAISITALLATLGMGKQQKKMKAEVEVLKAEIRGQYYDAHNAYLDGLDGEDVKGLYH